MCKMINCGFHCTAIGFAQIVSRKRAVKWASRDQPHIEQHHPIKIFGGRVEIVMHTHHCFAALAQVLQQGDDGAVGVS